MCVCVCVCVRVWVGGRGKNNIKEGGPHGSRVAQGGNLKKTKNYSPDCGAVSGAYSGHGRGPHLSQNLWDVGVMSPRSLLFRAEQRPAAYNASS